MTTINEKKVRGGVILFIFAPLVFFTLEAISTSACANPTYSYFYNLQTHSQ